MTPWFEGNFLPRLRAPHSPALPAPVQTASALGAPDLPSSRFSPFVCSGTLLGLSGPSLPDAARMRCVAMCVAAAPP